MPGVAAGADEVVEGDIEQRLKCLELVGVPVDELLRGKSGRFGGEEVLVSNRQCRQEIGPVRRVIVLRERPGQPPQARMRSPGGVSS